MKNKAFLILLVLVMLAAVLFELSTTPKATTSPTSKISSHHPIASAAPKPIVQRFMSPNNQYEALVIDSETTLIHSDKPAFYIPSSENIWLFEIQPRKYTQLTEHSDYVSRGNIHWTSDNKLIFTEGELTVSQYDPKTNKKKILLGPNQLEPNCVEGCEKQSDFITSPQKNYYIRLTSGANPSIPIALEWVNITTGTTGKVEGQYDFVIDEIKFSNENQFTIPSQTVQPTGVYGDAIIGPKTIITITMN